MKTLEMQLIKCSDFGMSGFGPEGIDPTSFGMTISHPVDDALRAGYITMEVRESADSPVCLAVHLRLRPSEMDGSDGQQVYRNYHMECGATGLVQTWEQLGEFHRHITEAESIANIDRMLIREFGFVRSIDA